MWEHFFTYRTEIPEGLGWEHFSPVHVAYLVVFVIAAVVLVRVYRRADTALRRRIQISYALAVAVLELLKDLVCVFQGIYDPELLPLHLCGMTIVIIAIHTARPNKTTAELLYSLSLPGSLAALLFSDWTMYPFANYFFHHSFIVHFLEVSYPILLLSSGELRPRFTQLWRCVVCLAVVVPPIYFLNKVLGTNYFFVNEAASGSPLAPLQDALGNPGYLVGFVGLLFGVWLVLYAPWMIKTLVEKRRAARAG